jgi:uncharacterized SAM-dependent methyltransferase
MLAICYKNIGLIEQDVNQLVFHMQGGLDYDDAFLLTADQRKLMAKMIQKHYDDQNPNKKPQL